MSDPHTPLPWQFVPWHIEEGPSAVRAPAGYLVTTTASDADAQFIVKAVNNHDLLIAQLHRLAVFCCDDLALALVDALTASVGNENADG